MTIRPHVLAVAITVLCLFWSHPLASGPQESSGRQYQAMDDLGNRGQYAGAPDASGHGGHGNNGHGNNADGTDSSNPGHGPWTDASCDGADECVDDELAAP